MSRKKKKASEKAGLTIAPYVLGSRDFVIQARLMQRQGSFTHQAPLTCILAPEETCVEVFIWNMPPRSAAAI